MTDIDWINSQLQEIALFREKYLNKAISTTHEYSISECLTLLPHIIFKFPNQEVIVKIIKAKASIKISLYNR